MIEFCLRLNLQSRAYTGALTDRTGVPNGTYQRGKYWWYRFRFAGERINEPTKSTSRTVAKEAERQDRRALEAGYSNFKEVRQIRVRILEEIIDEYLTGYRLRYRSASFAEYALGHPLLLFMSDIILEQHANLLRQGAIHDKRLDTERLPLSRRTV